MKRKELVALAARVLGSSNSYVKNKESDRAIRFNFYYNKQRSEIEVFNAKKGDDLFLWCEECMGICSALGLSHFIHIDKYGCGKLSFHIY